MPLVIPCNPINGAETATTIKVNSIANWRKQKARSLVLQDEIKYY